MNSWDGRCKRCRRLMSICKCFVAPASGDQNSNPNALNRSSDDDDALTSPMQLAHGKRHLFETLKERHPMRSNVLLKSIHGAGERDSERPTHEPQYTKNHPRKLSVASGARSRTDTRESQHHRVGAGIASRRPPSVSSSVPSISSHISRPSTSSSSSPSSVHRHSSPVPPRQPATIPMPTSNSDPAGIKYYQTHPQSSSRPSTSSSSSSSSASNRRSQRVDSSQYYIRGGGYPVVPPDETDPATYEL